MTNDTLMALISEATEKFNAKPPDTQAEMRRLQRRSWVIGQLMMINPELTYKEAEARALKAEKDLGV